MEEELKKKLEFLHKHNLSVTLDPVHPLVVRSLVSGMTIYEPQWMEDRVIEYKTKSYGQEAQWGITVEEKNAADWVVDYIRKMK